MPELERRIARRPRGSRAGNTIIEFVFMAPWYLFLFIGFFDMGLYNYALISTQAAARIAATYTSTSAATATDTTTACRYALAQLRNLPNVPTSITTCNGSPVSVTATLVTGPDGNQASLVTVSYVLPALAGIPGLLPGQYTAVQSFEMKLQS